MNALQCHQMCGWKFLAQLTETTLAQITTAARGDFRPYHACTERRRQSQTSQKN